MGSKDFPSQQTELNKNSVYRGPVSNLCTLQDIVTLNQSIQTNVNSLKACIHEKFRDMTTAPKTHG